MRLLFWKESKMAGLAPGTLVHVGERKVERPIVTVFDYGKDSVVEKRVESMEECFDLKDTRTVSWINVDGIHDTELISTIGKHFGLHPLVQEDILNTQQRPKVENFEDYLFIVLKMISHDEKKDDVDVEQVSLILGKNFVITFQEKPGDVFEGVRERIRKGKGKVRGEGSDYLTYALIDAIVDSYFVILEKISEKVEDLESAVMDRPTPRELHRIHRLKSGVIFLRKSIWPLRDMMGALMRDGSGLIKEKVEPYLRDLYDHTMRVTDAIDTFREMLSGLLEVYMSSVSNRMNEIMKVLTIFAAIFIPLTFVAGVYGMNFEFMPELKWRMGYPMALAIMACVAGVMLLYFNRKRWL
jgi:magnesium transporter